MGKESRILPGLAQGECYEGAKVTKDGGESVQCLEAQEKHIRVIALHLIFDDFQHRPTQTVSEAGTTERASGVVVVHHLGLVQSFVT